jgi:hypothetical protein
MENNNEAKGIRAEIYKTTASYAQGDFSNGGISATCQHVTIIGPGIKGNQRPDQAAPAVILHRDRNGYLSARPAETPAGKYGPSFGGTFIYTSGTAYREATGGTGPVPLHDRFESAEEYDRYSR